MSTRHKLLIVLSILFAGFHIGRVIYVAAKARRVLTGAEDPLDAGPPPRY